MILNKSFSKNRNEAFRLWQENCDAVIRSWMTSPFYLGFNSFWLKQSLNFYQLWLENARKNGFDANALHNSFKSTLNLFSIPNQTLMTDIKFAQTVGFLPKTAQTSSEVILRNDEFRLLRYESKNRKYKTPLLIVSSLIGKYYILDLTAQRSYVSYLLEQGFDVFIIDWTPTEKSETKGLNDYICSFLTEIVEAVCKVSESEKVSLLGYSMGGIFALIYSALYADKVKNLTLLTVPTDFSKDSTISDWTSEEYFDIDRITNLFGNISGETVSMSMQMVKPMSSFLRGVNILQFAANKEDFDALMALEIWMHDATPLPAKLFKDVIKKLYRQNLLIKNELKIGGKKVDLKKITASVLNVIGTHDQVATPETSKRLLKILKNTDKTQLTLAYGHLTIAVGSGAKEDFWQKSAEWLKDRS